MRVLLTTDTVGGVWTFTQELAGGLLKRGHAVAVASVGPEPNREQSVWVRDMQERFGQDGAGRPHFQFAALQVPLEWMNENAEAYASAASFLEELITNFRAEVLHSNQFCFGALPVAGVKVVTAHSDVLSWARACREQALPETVWLMHYRALVKAGLRGADAVTAPTHWMMDALCEGFGVPARRQVIPNGRDACRWAQTEAAPARKLQAISAGRLWDEAKNVGLLEAIKSPMPVIVAGEEHFADAACSRGSASIEFVGVQSEAQMMQRFLESSVYVVTSRYEPFGLAPLEAASCGCAIVANDLPSLREVWAEDALYFSSAAGLQSILQELCANPQTLHLCQERALARAKTFSGERMVSAYESLYERLLAEACATVCGDAA